MSDITLNQHKGPPVPPQELVRQWARDYSPYDVPKQAAAWGYQQAMATITEREQAAADAELEAMLVELKAMHLPDGYADRLRAARRPKPPSDKQQALADLDVVIDRLLECGRTVPRSIRRALEQLPD
jgi:hypothetical protein